MHNRLKRKKNRKRKIRQRPPTLCLMHALALEQTRMYFLKVTHTCTVTIALRLWADPDTHFWRENTCIIKGLYIGSESLVSLSSLPKSRWVNLSVLELVRERNKPKE